MIGLSGEMNENGMTRDEQHKTFPLARGLTVLTGLAGLLVVGAWLALPRIFSEPDLIHSAIAFCAGVTWTTAVLALLLVGMVASRGVMPIVAAHFSGMAVRLVLCLASVVWAVRTGWLPAPLIIGTMFIFYIPLLLAEVALVGRFLWRQDEAGLDDEPSPNQASATTEVTA